jgi:hypothetical protein
MKTGYFLATVAIAISTLAIVGCANNQTTTTSTNANSPAKTYRGSDLEKTGRQQTGEALQAADPAVSTSSGR